MLWVILLKDNLSFVFKKFRTNLKDQDEINKSIISIGSIS